MCRPKVDSGLDTVARQRLHTTCGNILNRAPVSFLYVLIHSFIRHASPPALAYQMGFSIDEIAEITEVAPATVKIRMFQARTGLHPGARPRGRGV
jgi:hypothetical protein